MPALEMPALEMSENASYGHQASLKNRVAAIALALVVELLIIIGLLSVGSWSYPKHVQSPPLVMQTVSADHPAAKKAAAPRAAPTKASPTKPPPPRIPPPISPKVPSPIIEMSKEDFAASDISKLGSHSADSASGAGKDGHATYGPGEGPGGAHLYNAEWHVRPSPGALAYYLPHGAPPDSWAMIACQTVPHYHVENCVGLSESPPGSGLAKALRLASWQFLVRPPSIDGKPMVGSWVRIRFDWTEKEPQ